MKINIGDNNKIENSNIGQNSICSDSEKNSIWKLVIEIIVGIIVAVISGYIIFRLDWN